VQEKTYFWGCETFCSNFPKPSRNVFGQLFVRVFSRWSLGNYFLPHRSWIPFFAMTSKKGLHAISTRWAPIVQNQTTLATIFARKYFANIFFDFPHFLLDFAHIFWDFARIFNKSKFLWVRLRPCIPPPTLVVPCHIHRSKKFDAEINVFNFFTPGLQLFAEYNPFTRSRPLETYNASNNLVSDYDSSLYYSYGYETLPDLFTPTTPESNKQLNLTATTEQGKTIA